MKSVRLLSRLLIAWSFAELLVPLLACFSIRPNPRPIRSLVLGMVDSRNVLPEISIPPTNLTWKGLSRAGEATSFVIPELRWMFDCGRVDVHWKPTCIFLTHTHADHVQALAHLLFSRNSSNDDTPTFTCQRLPSRWYGPICKPFTTWYGTTTTTKMQTTLACWNNCTTFNCARLRSMRNSLYPNKEKAETRTAMSCDRLNATTAKSVSATASFATSIRS